MFIHLRKLPITEYKIELIREWYWKCECEWESSFNRLYKNGNR